ncbi:hypothetical protein ACO0LM_10575 [Undibacterium sp. Di26W]|uniref:hypothetical protein n=1 Tax=Undibacterium sp. Di26W TaxID=3413035 RepID=UPI003BF01D4C
MKRFLPMILLTVVTTMVSSTETKPLQLPEDSQKNTAEAKPLDRGPVFVKGEITVKKDGEESLRDSESEKVKAKKESDLVCYTFWLMIFTALLFSVTFLLWFATYRLSRDARSTGDRQASDMNRSLEIAENSVKLARDEFIASHRPKLILRDATSKQDMGAPIFVRYIIANIGESDATIVTGALSVHFFKGYQFGPDNLPELNNGDSNIDPLVIKAGEQYSLQYNASIGWASNNDTGTIFSEGEYGLFFSGQIVYADSRGTQRRTGFRRKYISGQHRFLTTETGTHYEYQD